MLHAMLETLPDAARVTEQLVAHYGPDRIWQVERLSGRIFRAWMNDGGVVLATTRKDGSIALRELEAVC